MFALCVSALEVFGIHLQIVRHNAAREDSAGGQVEGEVPMHKDSALTAVILVAYHLEIKLNSERKAPKAATNCCLSFTEGLQRI